MSKARLFMGCDVGTGGVRVVVATPTGETLVSNSQSFNDCEILGLPEGWHEQRPERWKKASLDCLRVAVKELKDKGYSADDIYALAVTSTSGTLVALDTNNKPLYPAIMYNDGRAQAECEHLNSITGDFIEKMGYRFAASFALAKILWLKNNKSEIYEKTALFVHSCDYINGCLSGDFHITDFSNALKTGYDIADFRWPDFIESQAGIPLAKLPQVVKPGEVIGHISKQTSMMTGLPVTCQVCAGMTDSNAAFLATGAAQPGDWFTSLGTTLGVKGISRQPLKDPAGVIYCHRHPDGWWLPGAAGNTGGECLSVKFKDKNLADLDQAAAQRGPSNVVVYPLVRKGERFPFVNPAAQGFILGNAQDEIDLYRGYLEGVALTERLGYEILENLGADIGAVIYSGGGGSRSRLWMQIRADVLGKALIKPVNPEAAVGCAVLAASQTHFKSLSEAVQAMAKLETPVEPRVTHKAQYDKKYQRFKDELIQNGYLKT